MTVLPYEDYGFEWRRPDASPQIVLTSTPERAAQARAIAALLRFCWFLTAFAAWRAL